MQFIDEPFVIANSPIVQALCLDEVESTNTLAKELFKTNKLKTPGLIIAKKQTAGRGQRQNEWWAAEGSLAFSIVFSIDEVQPHPLTAFAAANAVAGAISNLAATKNIYTKWPNDIFYGTKKVAGILIESVRSNNSTGVIVGIGINSNCTLDTAPAELQSIATSILDQKGANVCHNELVSEIATLFFQTKNTVSEAQKSVVSTFESRSIFKIGSKLQVLLNDRQSENRLQTGKFNGFGEHGELILECGTETLRLSSARIQSFSRD